MPPAVEPPKPLLWNGDRLLNLWIMETPLTLDSLSALPRYVPNRNSNCILERQTLTVVRLFTVFVLFNCALLSLVFFGSPLSDPWLALVGQIQALLTVTWNWQLFFTLALQLTCWRLGRPKKPLKSLLIITNLNVILAFPTPVTSAKTRQIFC